MELNIDDFTTRLSKRRFNRCAFRLIDQRAHAVTAARARQFRAGCASTSRGEDQAGKLWCIHTQTIEQPLMDVD